MKFFLIILAFTLATRCSKSTDLNESNSDDNLHLSFTTPDWNSYINCDKLNLYPIPVNDSTAYVAASSASTLESFCFSIPTDSSKMMLASNFKKYAIKNYYENNCPFQFSQKLPLNNGSAARLVSIDSLGIQSYNEVLAINYVASESNYCTFKVKCKYQMFTKEIGNETNIKPVSGTFHFLVRTTKK